MHFCIKCGNMYYIKIDEKSEELIYNCRKCGHTNSDLINQLDNLCVSKTELTMNSTIDYSNIINEYTKLDPTLPRIDNIDCPNKNCSSNIQPSSNDGEQKDNNKSPKEKPKEKEIIYLRYDDKNMKYLYLCAVCDHYWNNNKICKLI